MGFVNVNGYRLHDLDQGAGTPVVLIHGLCSRPGCTQGAFTGAGPAWKMSMAWAVVSPTTS